LWLAGSAVSAKGSGSTTSDATTASGVFSVRCHLELRDFRGSRIENPSWLQAQFGCERRGLDHWRNGTVIAGDETRDRCSSSHNRSSTCTIGGSITAGFDVGATVLLGLSCSRRWFQFRRGDLRRLREAVSSSVERA